MDRRTGARRGRELFRTPSPRQRAR